MNESTIIVPEVNPEPIHSNHELPNKRFDCVLDLESGGKYLSLIEKVKMIARNSSHAMMSMGDVGVGKSTVIIETLKSERLLEGKDYIIMRGYSTAMALYEKLYQNREAGKIVVIDDCDVVLKNKTCLDILKAVLDDKYHRIVNYETRRKGADLPKSFVFTGAVIFITNYKPRENDIHFLAIQDRCMVQKLYLTTREKLEYIEKVIAPNDYKKTTLEERKKIFQLMKEVVIQGGVHFSYRTYFQLLDFYKHDLKNFGIHLRELLPYDNELTFLLKMMKDRPDDTEFWQSKWMEATGKSRRSYYYALAKVKDILPENSGRITDSSLQSMQGNNF
ncbi:MAG: hypothetical protein AB7O96_06970 [Pseudobdellovibrionaceae bacterium]